MVKEISYYDNVFHALADATRRDILLQLGGGEKTITEIAKRYSMSFAGIAKHLNVLESAKLVFKHKRGRLQIVSANPHAVADIAEYLKHYQMLHDQRFNNLEALIKETR